MNKENEQFLGCMGIIGIVLILAVCQYMQAYAEAEAYYHVTGKRVSVMDAMFLDLRVQAEPKPETPR